MKRNLIKVLVLTLVSISAFNGAIQAQSLYKLFDSKDADMKLSGTSTLHNWTMDAKTFTGNASFGVKSADANQLATLNSLTFSLEVENLKGAEKGLDKNAYKALKTGEFKDIHYKLTSAAISSGKDGHYLIKALGNLSIAGVTKEIKMDVHCVLNSDATITCTGSETLNMSDYSVVPPTFMLGAMKTGNAITLDFTLVYKKASTI